MLEAQNTLVSIFNPTVLTCTPPAAGSDWAIVRHEMGSDKGGVRNVRDQRTAARRTLTMCYPSLIRLVHYPTLSTHVYHIPPASLVLDPKARTWDPTGHTNDCQTHRDETCTYEQTNGISTSTRITNPTDECNRWRFSAQRRPQRVHSLQLEGQLEGNFRGAHSSSSQPATGVFPSASHIARLDAMQSIAG